MGLPRLNTPAPIFKTRAILNEEIIDCNLEDYVGHFVVIMFYPEDFSFVCPTEIISFGKKKAEFDKMNSVVIGISTDSVHSHLAWVKTKREQGGLEGSQMILASDTTHEIANMYGVLDEEYGYTYRAIFILDGSHTVRQIMINDYKIGRNVDEIIRLIKAIQICDEHGELCPADWNPGQEALAPTPSSLAIYLSPKSRHSESNSKSKKKK